MTVLSKRFKKFNVGKQFENELDFLGRHVVQYSDYRIEIDMDKYLRSLEKVKLVLKLLTDVELLESLLDDAVIVGP